jgi:hypothetical protein
MARFYKEKYMEREKQNYLVNPPFGNPFELFSVPSRRVLAETDGKGRFKKVVSLSKHRRHKAKKISPKTASYILKKVKAKAKTKAVKKIRTIKRAIKKHSKKVGARKVWTKANWQTYKALLKEAKMKPTRREYRLAKKHNVNPLLAIGNPIRRKVMKRRKYHKNPMFNLIKERQGKELVNLAIDGGVIVGGTIIGKFAMDKLSEKITFLQKPLGKIGGHLILGSAVYILGSKIKKIPNRITRLLALGVMLPAVVDVVDMVKDKIGGVKELGADGNAYLPETSAYVPETSAYVPETSQIGEETGY